MCNLKKIEFDVYSVAYDNDKIIVSGRCCKGPLSIGDKFNFSCKIICQRIGDSYSESNPSEIVAISLTIKSMKAYGRSFERLEEGMTAEVILIGKHNGAVHEGVTLEQGGIHENR